HRSFEDRIYSHLGDFYLEKLRYQDAASAYKSFVDLNPLHRSAPRFSMKVIEIYEQGSFPKLVLESKKQFAASYGLDSEYWRRVAGRAPLPEDQPPGSRGPLPRALPGSGGRRGSPGELPGGRALVSRVPRVLPEGGRERVHRLPARGPAARAQGLLRGGARVR